MAVVEGVAKITVDDQQAGQQIEKLENKARDLRNEIVKLRKEPLVDQKKIKNLQTQLKAVGNETKQIRQQTIDYRKTLATLSGASLKELNSAYKKLRLETSKLDRTTTQYKKNAGNLAKIRTEISKVKKEMSGAGTAAKGFGASMKNIASQMFAGGGVLAAVFAFVQIIKGAFNTIVEFGKAVSNLQAIMGKTKDGMAALKTMAKDLGATTAFTATQIIEAMTEMAKLGLEEDQILASTEAVLSLAAATGTELAQSAELAVATMKIFNIEASDMTRITDVLAKSTTISSLNMEKLATILPTVGKTAEIAGVSLERTAALAGTLTDRGLDASVAATSLRNIFLELANKGLTWNEAMARINESTDKNKTAMDLFGKRAASAGVILSQTAADTDELTESMENATGAAEEMAKVMLDNLSGDITIAQSAWQGFILSLEDGDGVISQIMRGVVQDFTEFLNSLQAFNSGDFITQLKLIHNGFINLATNAIPGLNQMIGLIETLSGKELPSLKFKIDDATKSVKKQSSALGFLNGIFKQQNDFINDVIKSEAELNDERQLSTAELEKIAKAAKKARDAQLKSNQTLMDQIEAMNTQLIQDDFERAKEELRIWKEKEERKIEISKASSVIKSQAVLALESLHNQKLLELEEDHIDKVLAQMEKSQALIDAEIAKQDAEIEKSREQQLADVEAHEQAKFAIRNEFGFIKLSELRDMELASLQEARDQELLTEREFQEAKFKTRMNFASQWVGAQKQHLNAISDILSINKQAELDAAGENEEAKLAIMKKFADKEFAIKVAQIVASTAQAVMAAFAQLGPIGGAIAAGLLTVKGISEVGKANAERNRIKGLEGGGKFPVTREQDGKQFNAVYGGNKRGFIHKPTVLTGEKGTEFVVSNKSLQIPGIKRFVSAVDRFQKGQGLNKFNYSKVISSGNRVRGFQDGGFTNTAPPNDVEAQAQEANNIMIALIAEFRAFKEEITEWQTELKTFVVFEDIEEAGDELNAIKTEVTLEQ